MTAPSSTFESTMRLITFVLTFLFAIAVHAQTLGEQIDALLAEKLPDANVGIIVQRLDTRERIYARNDHTMFKPASVTKLLTTYVAFKTLDFDHRFNTELFYDNNNVYIRFVGDPSFSSANLHALLDNLNVKRIKGDIIIDDTVFKKPYYARGWTYDSLDWYYSAPISSVMLDSNTVHAKLSAGEALDAATTIELTTLNSGSTLSSQVYTATEGDAETLCQLNIMVDDQNAIDLYGCWPINSKGRTLGIALRNPNLYVTHVIEEYLTENNIKLKGKIKTGKTPHSLEAIATHASPRLMDLAKPIMQKSDNFYTEAYTKTLGLEVYNEASFQAGAYAIQQKLYEILEINPEEVILSDGSGNSSYNLLTPNAIAQVLHAAFHDKSIQPAFRYALAKPGKDGSLKHRMKNLPEDAQFAGKTGILTNVSTLAGTMVHPDRVPLLVVIMQNGSTQKGAYKRAVEDEIVEIIYKAPVAQLDSASPS